VPPPPRRTRGDLPCRGATLTCMVTDPVCGMRIDPDDAVATVDHDGETYYFCSEVCRDAFVADPAAYIS
jgi:YHS domain-containing protein